MVAVALTRHVGATYPTPLYVRDLNLKVLSNGLGILLDRNAVLLRVKCWVPDPPGTSSLQKESPGMEDPQVLSKSNRPGVTAIEDPKVRFKREQEAQAKAQTEVDSAVVTVEGVGVVGSPTGRHKVAEGAVWRALRTLKLVEGKAPASMTSDKAAVAAGMVNTAALVAAAEKQAHYEIFGNNCSKMEGDSSSSSESDSSSGSDSEGADRPP